MFDYIRGNLSHASPLKATIEINGLGYAIHIPLNNYAKLPQIGREILLYLTPIIREDAHLLYGFLSRAERDHFEKLINISGVGPKTAIALIGHLEIIDLQLAISRADIALISKVPGIGKKTAERIVVELKDKIKNLNNTDATFLAASNSSAADAMNALVNLGYNPLHAQKAVKTALAPFKEEPELAELITAALRCI